ncbi:ATP-binding protein [Streptomyces sp. AM 4-1-1]|uniref:sensor histidine kinase n=1 Tax=unclassified Streptomyces TaxID=2593676 RepID=UPI0023B90F7C|nr:ATP-binding protein [Streptomyces sp. AM 4-1-1]WEH35240.1 ATP-binding protein [Streptomyces sp. AM 4-1-1]
MRPSFRPTALALLVTAAVTGSLCLWAVLAAPVSIRTTLTWGAGSAAALLSVAMAVTVHTVRTSRALRAKLAADTQRFTAESARLVSASAVEAQRFTTDTARIRAAASAETARVNAEATAEARRIAEAAAAEVARIAEEAAQETARLTIEAERARARTTRAETERSAAIASCANAAGRMQALATSMLADLREMEHRHTAEDVLGDLLHLDHRTAQAGRLADSIAVLTGARSGRRWAKPIVMESILRGAMGRIGGYQRVRLHSTSDVAIAGHAAEGVMHALAELLDNAANFSPPTAEVHVYVEEVPAGIVITVEDSGLVMSDVQLRRAEHAVSSENQDLGALSGTRLGLAVVGRLSRKHGLTVSYRPSARGGTGALMMLPQELIARTPAPVPALTASPTAAGRAALEPEPTHETAATEAAAKAADTSHPTNLPHSPYIPKTSSTTDTATSSYPGASPYSASGAPTEWSGETAPPADTSSDTTTGIPTRFGESGLPKRRRGRTLAAAESRNAAAAGSPDSDEPSRPRTSDPKTQADRFSSFRQAVRAKSPHPEGNTP